MAVPANTYAVATRRIVFEGALTARLRAGDRMGLSEQDEAPSGWGIAKAGWGSVRDTIGTSPAAFLVVVVILGAVLLLQYFAAGWWTTQFDDPFSWAYVVKVRAIGFGFDVAQNAILAIVAVPVYRMAVQDETTPPGELFLQVTLRVAGWLVSYRVVTFAFALPMFLVRSTIIQNGASLVNYALYIAAYGGLAQLILFYVWVRFGLLFPAVALGERRAGSRLGTAWRLSGQRQWRIIWSSMLAFLPLYVVTVGIAVIGFVSRGEPIGGGISWGTVIASDLLGVAGAALGSAVLGWNYRLITGRHHELAAETFA